MSEIVETNHVPTVSRRALVAIVALGLGLPVGTFACAAAMQGAALRISAAERARSEAWRKDREISNSLRAWLGARSGIQAVVALLREAKRAGTPVPTSPVTIALDRSILTVVRVRFGAQADGSFGLEATCQLGRGSAETGDVSEPAAIARASALLRLADDGRIEALEVKTP